MGIRTSRGFTIIEVMLFLGIAGVLAVGILVGSSVSIGQQRYRDAVSSFKTSLQEGYNQTANTLNDRGGEESCANGVVITPPDTVPNPQARGTSNCLMMGRVLRISADGKKIQSADIIGYRTSANVEAEDTDLKELAKNYSLSTASFSESEELLEWDATAVKPQTTTPYQLTVAIVRSPLSSTTMTFVADGNQTDLNAMVAAGVTKEATNICIDPDGGAFVGDRLAVRIMPYASSQNGIEIPSEGEGICD